MRIFSGLDKLASAIEAGEAMQVRARNCVRMRQPMSELQLLLQDAARLPVYVSDIEMVSGLLAKAQDWLRKANAAASQVCVMHTCVI